jgi:hypothetical protein
MTGEAGFLERIPWLPEEAKFLLISLIPQPLGTQLMASLTTGTVISWTATPL